MHSNVPISAKLSELLLYNYSQYYPATLYIPVVPVIRLFIYLWFYGLNCILFSWLEFHDFFSNFGLDLFLFFYFLKTQWYAAHVRCLCSLKAGITAVNFPLWPYAPHREVSLLSFISRNFSIFFLVSFFFYWVFKRELPEVDVTPRVKLLLVTRAS